MTVRILQGDCRLILPTLDAGSVQCCVTSPPYYGLRDYGVDGQIGLEQTPDEYVAQLVEVFRGVRLVLREDGTLWLNLGDSYSATQSNNGGCSPKSTLSGGGGQYRDGSKNAAQYENKTARKRFDGVKPKDLLGIPWRVAFALQADGWWLRSAIVWHKPNPMPESVRDRPTSAYEMVFLMAKSDRYFYDADAIAEPSNHAGKHVKTNGNAGMDSGYDGHRTRDGLRRGVTVAATRNIRNVWTITTQPYAEAHFATMPPELAERCIKAGTRLGDTVLDPFGGAGTTGLVADRLQRHAVLIELNTAQYTDIARNRIANDAPLFASVT